MELELQSKRRPHRVDIDALAASIAGVQLETGEIPWYEGGKTLSLIHISEPTRPY